MLNLKKMVASFWALRHYAQEEKEPDPGSVDPDLDKGGDTARMILDYLKLPSSEPSEVASSDWPTDAMEDAFINALPVSGELASHQNDRDKPDYSSISDTEVFRKACRAMFKAAPVSQISSNEAIESALLASKIAVSSLGIGALHDFISSDGDISSK